MIRKTLTILSLIGLLLSVGLWGVSYFNLACATRRFGFALTSGVLYCAEPAHALFAAFRPSGAVEYAWGEVPKRNRLFVTISWGDRNPNARSEREFDLTDDKEWVFAGFENLGTRWIPRFKPNQYLVLPFWMPTILFAFLYSFPLRTFHRRRKRKRLGLCLKCGYDLRGSKERCPECGIEIEVSR